MAAMIRHGYPELYKRNEYVHALEESGLTGLVVEVTGLEESSKTIRAIVQTFLALASFANFEFDPVAQVDDDGAGDEETGDRQVSDAGGVASQGQLGQLRFSPQHLRQSARHR